MALPKYHNPAAYHLCVLLFTIVFSSVVAASESFMCTIPSATPKHLAANKETLSLLHSFQLSIGYFFGGEDIHFAKDEGASHRSSLFYIARSLSFVPLHVDQTTNADLIHVAGTLTLSGRRTPYAGAAHQRRKSHGSSHSVSFHLDGYYSFATAVLCMVGSGAYTKQEDGSTERLLDVVLRLRVPSRSSLLDPFVTGRLKGADFEAISLVAYTEGDTYKYGESESCPPSRLPSSTTRDALQALGASFSCAHLKEQLLRSYRLQYDADANASSTSRAGLRLQVSRLHVGQVQCTVDGAVRMYAAFSNGTNLWGQQVHPRPPFMVEEEAVVAEGRWDSAWSVLCLRACRVVRSGPTSLAVPEQDCGIGMSFWFPAVWTIGNSSVVAGMLWNSSQETSSDAAAGQVSVSSIDFDYHRNNLSDIKYRYTMVEEAKKHYFTVVLNNQKINAKGSFPAVNYTYHDFEFRFHMDDRTSSSGHGDAHPITIGSAMVYGDPLAADDSFSRHVVAGGMGNELLTVSYNIDTQQYVVPAFNFMRPNMSSFTIEERQITAEGVYDPQTGVLCMIGCREFISGSSTDCKILITVQFTSLDAKAQGQGKGVISSLRNTTDPLFFQKMDISLFGNMYREQVSEVVSRMDMESVMLVISTTLPCVFTALQILHAKRNTEAAAATSVTMLVVLALGYIAPLVISSEALFASRRTQYLPFLRNAPYELNQVMLRVPTLIAFVLQLRLIQHVWSARASSAAEQSNAERRSLWTVCFPMYLLGGAVTIVFHVISNRTAAREGSLAVWIGPEPATLWQDLVSSAGLALDGFLMPQVAMNALSAGARVVRAVSPWLYVGGTVVRVMPHVYDVIRAHGYAPSPTPSYVYASTRDDLFGVAWDIVVPCVTVLLAVLLFLQQRRGGRSRRPGGYEMVSTI